MKARLAWLWVALALLVGVGAGFLIRDQRADRDSISLSESLTVRDANRHMSLLQLLATKQYGAAEQALSDYLYGDLVSMQVLTTATTSERFRSDVCALTSKAAEVAKARAAGDPGNSRTNERLGELRAACVR